MQPSKNVRRERKDEQMRILLSFPSTLNLAVLASGWKVCHSVCFLSFRPFCRREPARPASGSRRMENNMWPIRAPLSTACFASSGPWPSASGVLCYLTSRLWLTKRPCGDRRNRAKTHRKKNKALPGGQSFLRFLRFLLFLLYDSVSPSTEAQMETTRLLRWPIQPQGWRSQSINCKTTRVQATGAFLMPLSHPPLWLRGSSPAWRR